MKGANWEYKQIGMMVTIRETNEWKIQKEKEGNGSLVSIKVFEN